MSKGFTSNYRLILLSTTVLVCFASVAVRLVHLHVVDRERLVNYVDRARASIVVEPARRGDILDARGDVLATSRTVIELGVDPQMLVADDQNKWPQLAALLDLNLTEMEALFATKLRHDKQGNPHDIRWAKLCESIEESTYLAVQKMEIKGVYGNRSYRRTYPRKSLAAHVIGFLNKENKASGGIESFTDFYLSGQDGWRESEKDGLRREMAQFRSREIAANDGYDVVLSIDSVVQHLIETELKFIGETYEPVKATILVSDAESGFLLGMANFPSFDLNEYGSAKKEVLRNIAATDLLDPGSTFKIVAAAGALDAGLVTPTTEFNCSLTSINYNGRVRKFMPDDHPYDHPLTVAEIISQSSNVGAAQLGMRLGEQGLYDQALRFGFGDVSGFQLGYESPGILRRPETWSALEITRIPAGYSISATPLQIHYAMASIASGGELMLPQIVSAIRDRSGADIYTFGGISRRRVMKESVAEQMAMMLVGVTAEGTAKGAAIPGYQVAGKTGTAQKLIDGRYSNKHHVGSFVGFFPANHPRVVITVIVDDAKLDRGRLNYGSAVAVPSFKRIAEKLISYLDIKPAESVPILLASEGIR
jgi:cell division protein FtsI (penicillin-binding protein 3)